MAWSLTALGSITSATDLSAYSTGSYTPTADRLLVAIVQGSDTGEVWAAPTLAGNGVTWELILEGASATDRGIALFAAKSGASPSIGALTATFGDTQTGCIISVFEIDGADLSGTATAAFVQAKYDATGGPATSFSVTLDNAPAATSRCVAGFSIHTTNVALTPRTDWTEIHDIGHSGPINRLISEWRSDASEQTASASTTAGSSQSWRALAAEIAAAGVSVNIGQAIEVELGQPITPFISDLPITDDLILHLDASVLALADQDPVTTWNDLSLSGLVLVDGAFTPPTFVTPSLNGLGGVEFPSNNTALEDTSSVSLAGPRTLFLVVHTPDEDATWRYIHPQGAGLLIVKGPGAGNFIFGSDGGSGLFIEFTDVAYSDTDVLFTFVQQTTGAFVRADQVQKVSGNLSSVPAITTVRFGNTGGSAGSGGISFVLHEVVMYDGVLSSGDIDLVEDYLFDKWFGAPATITVNQAPEVESAQPITPLISREVAVGQAVEAELGQTIDPQIARRVTVNQASETELGQSVTPVIGRMVPVGTAAEAEAANSVTPRINRVVTIGIATEVELARLISPIKPIIVPVQTAVERELARMMTAQVGEPFNPDITCETTVLPVSCAILTLGVECETS